MPTCLHTAIWEEWRLHCGCLKGTNMTEAMSSTFLRTSACVITSVHRFFSWGPIIMKAFGMREAQFYVLHSAITQSEYAMKNSLFVQLTISNAQ
jgi:hypothetical protein